MFGCCCAAGGGAGTVDAVGAVEVPSALLTLSTFRCDAGFGFEEGDKIVLGIGVDFVGRWAAFPCIHLLIIKEGGFPHAFNVGLKFSFNGGIGIDVVGLDHFAVGRTW